MDYNEYKQLSKRTINNNISDNTHLHVLFVVSGIVGEAGELYEQISYFDDLRTMYGQAETKPDGIKDIEDKIYEEMGDVLFYIQWLDHILDLQFELKNGWPKEEMMDSSTYIPFAYFPAIKLLEYVKKVVAGRKSMNKEIVKQYIYNIMYTLGIALHGMSFSKSLSVIANENVTKLQKRYPGGYSVYSS